MSLVGDIIMGARELFTDPPQTMVKPALFTATATTGGSLVSDTYTVSMTAMNQWGESDPSASFDVVIDNAPGNAISFNWSGPTGSNGVYRFYIKGSGLPQVSGYDEVTNPTNPYNINTANNLTPGQPPNRNSAYLPDTNGPAVSASLIYRWINDGLKLAASINNGGLPSFTAVGTDSGQPLYTFDGQWKKVDNCWYDGYPVALGRKTDIFRKNKVSGWSATIDGFDISNALQVEVWPQPSRTSGRSTLNGGISATATSIAINTPSPGWVLPFGMAKIGTEIIAYANLTGNTLTGCKRGMAGTRAAAWADATAVTELNLQISGYRVPTDYSVGDSTQTLALPPGWEHAIETYLLHRFKKAEQQMREAQSLLQEFTATMQQLAANAQVLGPRQIQVNAGRGVETYPGLGTPFGGVIVP